MIKIKLTTAKAPSFDENCLSIPFNKTDIKIQFVKDGNIVKEGDAAEIYQLAIAELQKKQIRIGSLTSTISELTGKDYTIPNDPFLVLSVNEPYYGAAVILNEVVMNSLYERIGTFYIVPCSIHEVILVPKSIGKLNLEEMRKTVVHVNETELAPADIFSDQVYQFDGKEVKLA